MYQSILFFFSITWNNDLTFVSSTRLWFNNKERNNGWEYCANREMIPVNNRLTYKEFCNIFSNLKNIVRKNGPKLKTYDFSFDIRSKKNSLVILCEYRKRMPCEKLERSLEKLITYRYQLFLLPLSMFVVEYSW